MYDTHEFPIFFFLRFDMMVPTQFQTLKTKRKNKKKYTPYIKLLPIKNIITLIYVLIVDT